MIGYYTNIVASILFSAFGLIGIIIWSVGAFQGQARHREKLFGPTDAQLLRQTGAATTIAILAAFLVFFGIALDARYSLAEVLLPLVLIALFVVLLCIVLWIATLFLSIKAKLPRYIYHLPKDADSVRRSQCEQGIALIARFYPESLANLDLIDAFARSTQVAIRRELYPKQRKDGLQLTNDFTVYCNLSSEGFQQGYAGFLAACQAAPDHLEHVRSILRQWPDAPEAERLMNEWTPRLLKDGKEE